MHVPIASRVTEAVWSKDHVFVHSDVYGNLIMYFGDGKSKAFKALMLPTQDVGV